MGSPKRQFAAILILAVAGLRWDSHAIAGSLINPPGGEPAFSGTPEICVGFSGGGVRAAAVAIGALRQLHHERLLSEVDIVSGTSGGSWGLLWLYANAARTDSLDDVMGNDSLMSTPALQRAEDARFFDLFWRGWSATWSVVRLGKSAFYAALVNSFGAGEVGYTYPSDVQLAIENHQLPTPIVTLTALPGRCKNGVSSLRISRDSLRRATIEERTGWFQPLHKYIVEVTPWGWGSPARGYSTNWPIGFASLEDWVRSSGAYVDYPLINSCPATTLFGVTWGEWLHDRSRNVERFYAVDGGFSENLAVYPLIRRACELVVIIDAEHDPALQFEGYRKLRSGLQQSLGASLSVPEIDSWITNARYIPIGADIERDRTSTMNATDVSSSLVGIPLYEGEYTLSDKRRGKLLYLKLSLDPERVDDYSQATNNRYHYAMREKCKQGRKIPKGCDFPHTYTGRTAYAQGEFAAHRDLASWLVRTFLAPDLREYLRAR